MSHSVLEHGATLSSLNGTNDETDWWCDSDQARSWVVFLSLERIAAGLGGLLPFEVVGALLLLAGSGLALAR